MNEGDITEKRIKELALRAYGNNYYTCTNFLGIAQISALKKIFMTDEDLKGMPYILYGGVSGCERCVAAFGSEEMFGYQCEFPISCILIKPRMQKYADKLTHRDILGATLNLGTKRETIGDIYIDENEAYMFCLNSVCDYIMENLIRIRHTFVSCELTEKKIDLEADGAETEVLVSSLRLDGVIAKVYKTSRSAAQSLIRAGRVYINGVVAESVGRNIKAGEIITVRGYGRMEYKDTLKETKKGNLMINIIIWR